MKPAAEIILPEPSFASVGAGVSSLSHIRIVRHLDGAAVPEECVELVSPSRACRALNVAAGT